MAVQIILKNSSVEDKRPTASQLTTGGEISLNYNEAGAFLCCRDTDGNIQQIGGIKISNDAPGTPVKGTLWFQPTSQSLFIHNGSSWLEFAGGGGSGGGGGAVSRIIAGDGIDSLPASGTGVVTINADIDTERGLEFVAGEIAVNIGAGLTFNNTTGAIEASATALSYKGTIDLTTAGDVPATPAVGDTYANTGSGAFDSEWVAATGEPAGTNADPGDLVVWNGVVWTFIPTGGSGGGGGGATNLSYTPTTGATASQGGTVVSSTGTNADIPMVGHSDAGVLGDAAQAGLMSPVDKDKLDNIDVDADGNITNIAQEQADWDEDTTTDPSYIQNKPTIEVNADNDITNVRVDLGYTPELAQGTVTNDSGDDAVIPFATAANAGLFIEPSKPTITTQYARQVTDAGLSSWVPVEAGGSVSIEENPPANPDAGDLWWDSSENNGRLYIWYVDGDSEQWVETSPSGEGGGGGGEISSGETFPPSGTENELFFNTTDGRLYIYYNDGSSSQWVDASPDGIGGGGDGGSGGSPTTPGVRYQEGTWTPTSNGNLDNARGYWSRNGSVVTAWFSVNFGSQSSNSSLFVEGFPYARQYSSNSFENDALRTGGNLNWTSKTSGRDVMFDSSPNSRINFRVVGSEASVETITGGSEINYRGSVVYLTDDTTFAPVNSAVVTEDIQGTGGSGGGGTTEIYGTAKASGDVAANGTLRGGLNCTVTKEATVGNYTVSFLTPMPDSNYVVTVSGQSSRPVQISNKTTTEFTVRTRDSGDNLFDNPFDFAVHDDVPVTVSGGSGGDGTTINYNGTSAWLYAGTDGTILNSHNISSVTKSGTGTYDIVFKVPMGSQYYSAIATPNTAGARYAVTTNKAVNGFTVRVNNDNGTVVDSGFNVAVHAENAIAPQSGVGADAWGKVLSTGDLVSGFNCTVTRPATGRYEVLFNEPLPNANYAIVGSTYVDGNKYFSVKEQSPDGFTYDTKNGADGSNLNIDAYFAVFASSTVTPTYTWTRDGTTLKPANDGDDIEAGVATFNGTVTTNVDGGQFLEQRYNGIRVVKWDADGRLQIGTQVYDTPNITLNTDGSATFAKNKTQFFSNGGFATYPSTSDTATRVRVIYSGPTEQAAVSIEGNGQASSNAILVKQIGGTDKVIVRHDGSAVFKGGVTPSNVFFNLEADDDTKYTATTDSEGEETLVYNGPTLDVKALLLTLQTAAARIETLEAKVQTLEESAGTTYP